MGSSLGYAISFVPQCALKMAYAKGLKFQNRRFILLVRILL